jgi:L-glutamine-phosphate cytidylyltransferase
MKAVIVAAGRSSRLYPLTRDCPKSLLHVGGASLVERSVDQLEQCEVEEVLLVVGFMHERLREALGDRVRFIYNPFFAETNNLGSMWLAIPHLRDAPFVYLHGDVIYSREVLEALVRDATDGTARLAVDYGAVDEEAMKVRVADGRFVESSKEVPLNLAIGEWTGIARFCGSLAGRLHAAAESVLADRALQAYDTAAFNLLAQDGVEFELVSTQGNPWMEIDTHEDLEAARALFQRSDGV